jgi:3',5'-nucleoside bisphosphate phosphatase
MRRKREPLLCELHAHTNWSDGALSLPELVDLYGRSGFDVLAITDHVNRTEVEPPWGVRTENHAAYLAAIQAETERALRLYDLVLVPGVELSYNDADPFRAAHAVAVGLSTFVGLDDGLEAALDRARGEGAAIVAAHPFRSRRAGPAGRLTLRFARDWRELRPLVDRWELFNRDDLFSWVAQRGLPAVANGDFHRPEHLHGWKTLLPCAKEAGAVVDYLRSQRPAFLTRIEPPAALRDAA